MFVSVQDKSTIYRWSSDEIEITVGLDVDYALLPTSRLEAEPLLMDCSGPMNNYQCGGRGEAKDLSGTALVVSGKLHCDDSAKKTSNRDREAPLQRIA